MTVLNSVADTAKVIRRIGYRFGGQLIATRVEATDEQGLLIDNPAFTGLFYVHSDHLGSANALSYGQDRPALAGTLVPGSVARFLPFGGYRGGQPQTNPAVSSRGFTGHRHNDYIKLVDMRARWYAPEIGRFISPDTIVPDPTNPQSFNRYSYVNNNPINFTDPTGHCAENGDETCWSLVEQISRMFPDYPFPDALPQLSEAELWAILADVTNYSQLNSNNAVQLSSDEQIFLINEAVDHGTPDALMLGVTGSGAIGANVFKNIPILREVVPRFSIVGGAEILISLDEAPSFFLFRGAAGSSEKSTSKLSGDIGFTLGSVYNLGEHSAYAGPFLTDTVDSPTALGVQISYFRDPLNENGVKGYGVGPTAGRGASYSRITTEYYEINGLKDIRDFFGVPWN